MDRPTKEEFIAAMKRGYVGRNFCSHIYQDIFGRYACPIGAAAYGFNVSWQEMRRAIGGDLDGKISSTARTCETKEEAIRAVEKIEWSLKWTN